MSTSKPAHPPEPAKRGPKFKPPGEKVVKTTVSLKPATAEFLKKKGGGVLSQGIEAAVAEIRTKPTKPQS